jgi:hypothetical protein
MVDYKKAALVGAGIGTVASFIFGRKRARGLDWGKILKYAAVGGGATMVAGYAMAETGRPIGMLAAKGEFTGWEHGGWGRGWGHEHEHEGWGHEGREREHFRRW